MEVKQSAIFLFIKAQRGKTWKTHPNVCLFVCLSVCFWIFFEGGSAHRAKIKIQQKHKTCLQILDTLCRNVRQMSRKLKNKFYTMSIFVNPASSQMSPVKTSCSSKVFVFVFVCFFYGKYFTWAALAKKDIIHCKPLQCDYYLNTRTFSKF